MSKFEQRTIRSQQGVALIVVLGVVVLIAGFIVAFLLSTTSERSSSTSFAASVQARQLADTAVSLVQAQIGDATTQGVDVAWVSQPGMVRTFDDSGSLLNAYKLYSATDLITGTVDLAADLPPADWATSPGVWVDLNAPVSKNDPADPSKTLKIYPIADPTAMDSSLAKDGRTISGLGPSGSGGFKIMDPATRASAAAPGSTTYQPLPMPVRWLYVLQDGSVVPPVPASGGVVTLAGETHSNPVVGRIAFWTDDETAKVNINTAGEGVFWDTPRGYSPTEVLQLAIRQPWNGEFNRYPGHPGTVSLSALFPISGYDPGTLPLNTASKNTLKDYLSLTPAYAFGGSEGGNVLLPPDYGAANYGVGLSLMQRKAERLYSSVDELLFRQDRATNSLLTEKVIESRRFFLTAHSRAPETNLFNLPRIAIWPVQSVTDPLWLKKTNPFDRLISFCASTQKPSGDDLPYFFQRTSAYSTTDLLNVPRNLELYTYLQHLTAESVPGYGGKFLTKYGFPGERDEILTQMFDYVRTTNLYDTLLDYQSDGITPVNPKGTYTFTKSSAGINGTLGHGQAAPSRGPNGTMGQGRYFTLKELLLDFIGCADGSVSMSNDALYVVPNPDPLLADWKDPWINPMLREPFPSGPPVAIGANQMRVQLMIVPELFCTMAGVVVLNPDTTVEIKGLDQFRLNGEDLQLASGDTAEPCWSYFSGDSQQFSGGGLWDSEYEYKAMFTRAAPSTDGKWTIGNVMPVVPTSTNYAFVSAPVTVNKGTMNFTGGTITVNFYAGVGTTGSLLQSLVIIVPDGNFPVPKLANASDPRTWSAFNHSDPLMYPSTPGNTHDGVVKYRAATGNNDASWGRPRQRFVNASNAFPGEPIRVGYDVIRALVPASVGYDYRLISPVTNVFNPRFERHPLWDDTTKDNASQFTGNSRLILAAGKMALDTIYSATPFAGPGAANVDATGDFDLGPGGSLKGPLANKPDDGDMYRAPNANWTGITPDAATAPYFQGNRQAAAYAAYFTPNRIMPSPVMFGSLPTGVMERLPWQTLLFRPLAQAESGHKGAVAPKDALLLDLFWMPVVEPYAISDRLSTAGKINMNYQILPFTYIDRSAPLRAALKSERLSLISLTNTYNTKIFSTGPGVGFPASTTQLRNVIDPDQTLKQFEERFDQANKNKNVFISPSEICDMYMIAAGSTYTSKAASATTWNSWRQTGDNLREKVYATIYQKLTTKSNSYTVHLRAQSLKRNQVRPDGQWLEGTDAVTGEYRGSTTIERFINPEAEIPDYAAATNPLGELPLDQFYKWRAVSNKQFAP